MRCFFVGAGIVALVLLTGSLLLGQERSGAGLPPRGAAPAQLGSERSVAPSQPEASAGDRKRTELRRGLVGMVLLTLIVIAFLLFLMVLTARWTRRPLPSREARKPASLEDLWSKVQSQPASDEEIGRMLSEGTDEDKPKDGEPKTS